MQRETKRKKGERRKKTGGNEISKKTAVSSHSCPLMGSHNTSDH
jgi:hypothetical protein